MIGIAVAILVALAATAVVRAEAGSPQIRRTVKASKTSVDNAAPEASVREMRAALEAWSAFPIHAAPRPLVVLDDPVSAPASGFTTNDAKEAFLSGAFVAPATLLSGPLAAARYPGLSAADALGLMRSEGTPAGGAPAPPTPLVITTVRFDSAPFKTDRGVKVLPAWLFSFRGVVDPAAVLAVAPSSQFSAPATWLHQPSVGAQIDADGRTVTITFTGWQSGRGPCTASYTVDQLASSTAVAIKVRETRFETGLCDLVGHTRKAVVRLASPLGGRVLVDATTTGPVATAP